MIAGLGGGREDHPRSTNGLYELAKSRKQVHFLMSPQGTQSSLKLDFRTFGLQNGKIINPCCLKPLGL